MFTLLRMSFIYDPGIHLEAFLLSAVIGVLFGYMPAKRGARLDPMVVPRHE